MLTPEDTYQFALTPENYRSDKAILAGAREVLTGLPEGDTLSTADVAARLLPWGSAKERGDLARTLIRLGDLNGLCVKLPPETRTTGYMAGKEIRRRVWRRIDPSVALKQQISADRPSRVWFPLDERLDRIEALLHAIAAKLETSP